MILRRILKQFSLSWKNYCRSGADGFSVARRINKDSLPLKGKEIAFVTLRQLFPANACRTNIHAP